MDDMIIIKSGFVLVVQFVLGEMMYTVANGDNFSPCIVETRTL